MPPRKPLGVVSGVLRSPWASIQTSATPGWRSRTAASTGGTSVHSLITTTGVPAATALRLSASMRGKVGRERVLGRALPEPDDAVGEVHLARAVAARVLGDLHVLVPEAQPRGELDEPLLRLERGHAAAGELADEGLEHARRLTKRDASP